MVQKKLINDLTRGSVPKQLFYFAMPLFLSGLLQTFFNMVDMVIVGQKLGENGISAVSNGSEIMVCLTFAAMGLCSAGQIILSQMIGAGAKERASRLIGTMTVFIPFCALIIMAVCLIFRQELISILHIPAEAVPYALDYTVVCCLGLVFIYGYNLVSAILRGLGDSKHPFWFILTAVLINLVLDVLFVLVFDWKAAGAALATVIGQGFSFLMAAAFLWKNRHNLDLKIGRKDFAIHQEEFIPLISLGIPMILQTAAITFSKLYITSWINTYGVTASAVTGIGNKLQMIVNVTAQAFSTAGGSMIAQCIGAKRYERVRGVIRTSIVVTGIAAISMTIITLVHPEWIFGLFTQSPAVLEMASDFLPVAILLYLSAVLRPPFNALINGSGNTKLNFLIAILDGVVVRIGLALFLGLRMKWGIMGFWLGNALSSYVPFLIGGIYYVSGKWRTQKYILEKADKQRKTAF